LRGPNSTTTPSISNTHATYANTYAYPDPDPHTHAKTNSRFKQHE
jgi:hypothetical protein